ncbi:alcohol dehydrogenase catalytic domain-containing protein [Nonomuraea sp. NPDC049758]|uniref:alcohol dehydrogenase catalytic domain-containing protein n=1 Tax=Nonomuraea sp. NPDC049758 TaxID=3154360 RepID=UPI0034179C4D
MYGAGDVRVEQVPGPAVELPTDALVRVTASCICGSDLWPYGAMRPEEGPARMGHEFIGVVEDIGSQVTTLARGDLVVTPFAISGNTCRFCREGLHTSCADPQARFWDAEPDEGGQADGTLVKLPVEADSALMPSLLTLTDVLGTGHHAAVAGGVGRRTRVTVIGEGAVGLLAVLSARRPGAEQIILMRRHQTRTDLGRESARSSTPPPTSTASRPPTGTWPTAKASKSSSSSDLSKLTRGVSRAGTPPAGEAAAKREEGNNPARNDPQPARPPRPLLPRARSPYCRRRTVKSPLVA